MRQILLVRLVLLGGVLAFPARAAAPPSLDQCLQTLKTGPDSFLPYLCLGTPGLPERPAEVRKILKRVLERSRGEPHARLYLALMDVYALEQNVDQREFTEPLKLFEQRQQWVDLFLGQLAFFERLCIRGKTAECRALGPEVDRAERFAQQTKNPDLIRLAKLVRMRWTMQVESVSEARRVERELDAMPGEPPEWMRLLEVSTRTHQARVIGDDFKLREIYGKALRTASPGTIGHAAALAGVAGATAQLAMDGLADRGEAERLLRSALDEQRRLKLVNYNAFEIGISNTRALLALLLGRTPETRSFIDEDMLDSLVTELLLQGDPQDRLLAVQKARARLEQVINKNNPFSSFRIAHAELTAGSPVEGMRLGDRAIEIMEKWRGKENDDTIRIRVDATRGILYQAYISDLLDTGPENPEHLTRAWDVLERLRSRVLLAKLLAREPTEDSPREPIATVRDVQSLLRPDEGLASFFIWSPRPSIIAPYTRGHSYALVITRSAIRAVRLPRSEELEPAIKAWTRMLEDRNAGLERGSRRLYAELMKPVLDLLPANVHNLVLVPDGPLHRLPFDALSETGGQPYLADRYEISVVSSASVWTRLRSRAPLTPGVALAFANTPEGPAVAVAETRGEVAPGQLAALLHAREEAEEAVSAFPSGSKLYAGAEATPERLLDGDLRRASLVHFAAHGVANERDPDESFLLLAPAANGSGVLKVADVPRFDWTGRTVVLSACDTSVGALHLGEGVLSLARGFFAGGASAVIGTLSRVRDDDQRALFQAFYAELRRGVSVGDALVLAKRALIRKGSPPAAWANVIVLGDATVHPRAAELPLARGAILAGCAAGLALVALGLRTRRRKGVATSG